MFFILTQTPEDNFMNQYDMSELEEIFGEYNATQLANGISVFANGGIHVNAAAAAQREAEDMLVNG